MNSAKTALDLLNRDYLEVRAKLLEIAATFDRLDRAPGTVKEDPRLEKLLKGLAILSETRPDRAEQIQLLFSRAYEANWKQTLQLG